MKIPATVKAAAVFTAGLLIGAVFFFPWDAAANHAAASLVSAAGTKGVSLEIKESSSRCGFISGLLFSGISASSPIASARISYIEADPSLLDIIKQGGQFPVNIGKGTILMQSGAVLGWNSVKADVTVGGNGSVSAENLFIDGDIKGRGSFALSPSGNLMKADIAFTLPKKFDIVVEAISMAGSMPLKKDSSGEWRLKK